MWFKNVLNKSSKRCECNSMSSNLNVENTKNENEWILAFIVYEKWKKKRLLKQLLSSSNQMTLFMSLRK